MSADKRSVHTDALETLGTIINEHAGRDAIHVAVEPVQAGTKLYPGQDVGLVGGMAFNEVDESTGIVDPFLKGPVFEGQYFWMLLYPRTITSLRHVWSHPAFPESTVPAHGLPTDPFNEQEKGESKAWLVDFCTDMYCKYDDLIEAVLTGRSQSSHDGYCYISLDEDYLHFNGTDAHGEVPTELWHHIEVVTGVKIPNGKRAKYFSCSC